MEDFIILSVLLQFFRMCKHYFPAPKEIQTMVRAEFTHSGKGKTQEESKVVPYSMKFSYGANFRIFRMCVLHAKIKTIEQSNILA